NLMLRGGRLRSPVFMYSETLDVGYTYPWLRLPDEVYSLVQLTSYEGADAVYTLPLPYGSVTFQFAGGQAKDRDYYAYDDLHDMDYKDIFGASVSLASNDYGTLRVGYVEAALDSLIQGYVPSINQTREWLDLRGAKGTFTSIGYQYDNGTWLTANGYQDANGTGFTANNWLRIGIEGDGQQAIDAVYLMGGRRFGDFLAHLTYAQMDEQDGRQNSWTAGLNYQLRPTVVLKGEYKRVDTSGGSDGVFTRNAQEVFNSVMNPAAAPAGFDGDIISVGVDFVF